MAELDQCGYIVDTCIEHLDHVRAEAGRPVTAAELGAPPPETVASAKPETAPDQTAETSPEKPASAAAKRRRVRGAP